MSAIPTIAECQRRLRSGELTSKDLVRQVLGQIDRLDGRVGAYLSWDADAALRAAEAADAERASAGSNTKGEAKPLLGIPIAMKDIIAVKGQPLTCGSRILGKFVSPYDATVARKLLDAGAILLGRLNLDEFAMGSSNENSAFKPAHNPWDLERIPGGSSGGPGAAVAARECVAAIGTDTGGSVRQPAALCGVVGLKPSYGRVSRFGLVAYASSLDQIGPVTKSVEDAAILLDVLAGYDSKDSTSVPAPVPAYAKGLKEASTGVRGLRLGLPKEYFAGGLDPQVEQAVRAALRQYEQLGAEIVEISLPHTEYAIACYYIIATAEASANLARFDSMRYGLRVEGADTLETYCKSRGAGFGTEVKRRIILGTYVLSSGYYDAYYLRAQKVRTLIRRDFLRAFESVDAIVTPTSPTPAFKIGEKSEDPLQMYLSDIYTISCNLAGICGISVPCGFTTGPKLPVGLQLLGKPLGEETLLRLAYAYEQATPWSAELPPLAME